MKELIEVWQKRADRYNDLARNETNNFALERLYASAEAYSLCADELKRKVASQPIIEPDARTQLSVIEGEAYHVEWVDSSTVELTRTA